MLVSKFLFLAKKEKAKKNQSDEVNSCSDCSDDEIPCDEEFLNRRKNAAKKRSRVGISEEVFGEFNRKDSVEFRVIPKSEESKFLILGLIKSSILFSNIDEKDENTVITAMEEKCPQNG